MHLLQRAFVVYGDQRYERLSKLSISHLYNLRKRAGYSAQRMQFTKTRAVCNPIDVRKAPRPNGRAGWVLIDSVQATRSGRIQYWASGSRRRTEQMIAATDNPGIV